MRWIRVIATAAAAVTACARLPESPAANPSLGAAGASYALTSVEAHPLPATAYFGVDVAVRATAGTLVLAADHSFDLRVDFVRHFASGNRDFPFSFAEHGTWALTGDTLALAPAGAPPQRAIVAGDVVTLTLTVPDSPPPERATKPYAFKRVP